MVHQVQIEMRGTRHRMGFATGSVGDRSLRLRNGYGPSFGAISGDFGPDRVRLQFGGSAAQGTLTGMIADLSVDVTLHEGYVVGTVNRQGLQMQWSPTTGQPRYVSMPSGNPRIALEVEHQRLSRTVTGTVERDLDGVVAAALLMQNSSPTLWRRIFAYSPKRVLGPAT